MQDSWKTYTAETEAPDVRNEFDDTYMYFRRWGGLGSHSSYHLQPEGIGSVEQAEYWFILGHADALYDRLIFLGRLMAQNPGRYGFDSNDDLAQILMDSSRAKVQIDESREVEYKMDLFDDDNSSLPFEYRDDVEGLVRALNFEEITNFCPLEQ